MGRGASYRMTQAVPYSSLYIWQGWACTPTIQRATDKTTANGGTAAAQTSANLWNTTYHKVFGSLTSSAAFKTGVE